MQRFFMTMVRVTFVVATLTLVASTFSLPLALTSAAHAQIVPTDPVGGDGGSCGSCCPLHPCGLCGCGVCTGSGACSH